MQRNFIGKKVKRGKVGLDPAFVGLGSMVSILGS